MPAPSVSLCAAVCLVTSLSVIAGCGRTEPIRWSASELVEAIPNETIRSRVTETVVEHGGTARNPKLVTDEETSFEFLQHLKHGQAVYTKRCVQCHGVNGDGNGPMAAFLYPRPRDYTKGIFKFTSTSYGSRPWRDDLVRTVVRGVVGTSMPSFDRLPKKDVEAVVDYVLVMAQRGELESQLAVEAEFLADVEADEIDDALEELDYLIVDTVELVVDRWTSVEVTQPLTPQPKLTDEHAARGRKAFLTKGCSKCHGEDGRGHTKDNIGKDSWGHATRAADLTSGMLHGGHEPIAIYRRILNGINGTPMPGFRNAFAAEPETIWDLVAYVLEVSNRRRFGEAIPAGLIKPYETGTNTEADNDD